MSTRSIALVALLAALVAALGYLLSAVPNVELVSLGTFISGAALDARRGAAVGAIAMTIYSGLNPYCMAPPPTFVAQVLGCALIGAAGGRLGPWFAARKIGARHAALLGALGFALTFAYYCLTNLGTAASIGAMRDPWPVLAGGLAFGVWHMAWNTLFFAVLGPPLLASLARFRAAAP